MNVVLSGDHRLIENAQACLQNSPYFLIRKVLCECRQGVLVLRGRLPSFYQKQVVQVAVANLEGVQEIVNRIEVVSKVA